MEMIAQGTSFQKFKKQAKPTRAKSCNDDESQLTTSISCQKILFRNLKFLSKFVARLTESQREFCEQLGLSYARVFADGYEDFKGKKTDEVIFEWLVSDAKQQVKLSRLLNDVCKHQLALVGASDGIVEHAVETIQEKTTGLFNKEVKSYCFGVKENSNKRFNELVAPGLARAYVKQRENQK